MKKTILLIGLLPLLAACSSDSPNPMPDPIPDPEPSEEIPMPEPGTPISLSANEIKAKNAYNDFAFRFFDAAMNDLENGNNVCLSPFGVYQVMAMASNGDNGQTAEEMMRLMNGGDGSITAEDFNSYNVTMTRGLQTTDSKATVTLANAVWYDSKLTPTDYFRNLLQKYYNAEFHADVLSSEKCKNDINAWCAANTNGMIDPFLEHTLSEQMRVMIINALYFIGEWSHPFAEEMTYIQEFRNFDGSKASVPMMNNEDYLKYLDTESYSVASRPFGSGCFEMVFVLPDEDSSYVSATKNLESIISDFDTNAKYTNLCFGLPRFETAVGMRLEETLYDMGFHRMFTSGFNNMMKNIAPAVTKVLQKVKIEVKESGVSAAAVTAMMMDSSMGEEIPEMTLDRPFIYLIRETNSGTILFIGRQQRF